MEEILIFNTKLQAGNKAHLKNRLNSFLQEKGYYDLKDFYRKEYGIEKCNFCDKEKYVDLKVENGQILDKYQFYFCKTNDCPGRQLNGRSYEWLTKGKGLSKEEVKELNQTIGKKSAKTRAEYGNNNYNPFSTKYWIEKGYSLEESQYIINSRNRRRKEFWLERGYPENRAKNMAYFHSNTQSKEYLMYFKGFDEDEADNYIKELKEKKSNWAKNNPEIIKKNNGRSSKECYEFIKPIYDFLTQNEFKDEEIYFQENNGEYYLIDKDNNYYFYDFVVPDLNLVIEYNGTHVHPKQEWSENKKGNWKHAFTKENYNVIIEKDIFKENLALENNFYNYFIIWSDEDKLSKTEEIKSTIFKELQNF